MFILSCHPGTRFGCAGSTQKCRKTGHGAGTDGEIIFRQRGGAHGRIVVRGRGIGMEYTFSNRDFPHLGAALCKEAEEMAELVVPKVDAQTAHAFIEHMVRA